MLRPAHPHRRVRVTYRMAGQLVVMVVTAAGSNALAALDLLDRCVRVVTLDHKSPELSADRFAKRYQGRQKSLHCAAQQVLATD